MSYGGSGHGTTSVTLTGVSAGATILVFARSNSGATTAITATGFSPRGPLVQPAAIAVSLQTLIKTGAAGGSITITPAATGGGTIAYTYAVWYTGVGDVGVGQFAISTTGTAVLSASGADGNPLGPIGTTADGCEIVAFYADVSGTPTFSPGDYQFAYTSRLNPGGAGGGFIQDYAQASAGYVFSLAGTAAAHSVIGVILALEPTGTTLPTSGVRQVVSMSDPTGTGSYNYVQIKTAFDTLPGSTLLIIGGVSNYSGTHVQAAQNTGLGSPAPTGDPVNGQYTQRLNHDAAVGTNSRAFFDFQNAAVVPAGSEITLNLTADDDYVTLTFIEIAGVAASSYIASGVADQGSTAAGTDNIAATTALGSSPACIVAMGFGTTNFDLPLAGTGRQAFAFINQFGGSGPEVTLTSVTLADPGTEGALFSASATDTYTSMFAAYLLGSADGPGAALAGAPADTSTATGALTTGVKLAGAPADTSAVTAALTTQAGFSGTGSDISTASGALTNWATVTLTAPLYYGGDSIVGPNAIWTAGIPTSGSVIEYDGSSLTINVDGSLVATSNNFQALAQWFNGSTWSQVLVAFTPGLVSYATANSAAVGALTTAIRIAGAATGLSAAAASLTVYSHIAGAATALSSATGALTAQIKLSAAAVEASAAAGALSTLIRLIAAAASNTAATGAMTTNAGGAPLLGSASDIASASGTLSTLIRMAGAAATVSIAAANLVTQIKFTGSAVDSSIAIGALGTNPQFAGNAVSATAAAGAITTLISLAASAADLSAASAALSTQITLLGGAADLSGATGALATLTPLAGAAESITVASGTLSQIASLAANALSSSAAGGVLSSGIGMIAAATSLSASYGGLTAVGAGMFSDAVIVFAPPKNAPGAEQLIFGMFSQRIGEAIAYGINWDSWLAEVWAPDTDTTVGQAIRPSRHIGYQCRCVIAGVTGANEPAWPAYSGAQIMDGSTLWKMEPQNTDSLAAFIEAAQWTSDASIAANLDAIRGEITMVVVDTTNAPAGDHDVLCTAQLSDAETKTGKLRIKVQ